MQVTVPYLIVFLQIGTSVNHLVWGRSGSVPGSGRSIHLSSTPAIFTLLTIQWPSSLIINGTRSHQSIINEAPGILIDCHLLLSYFKIKSRNYIP